MKFSRRRALVYLFGTVFIGLGCGQLYIVAPRLYYGARSTGWPVVEGVVTESGSGVTFTSDRRYLYSPRVRYTYTRNGAQMTGMLIGFSTGPAWSEASARKQAAAYPVGRRVRVSYDPEEPSRAVVEPGIRLSSSMYAAFGLVLILGGLEQIRHPDPIARARARRKRKH